MVVLVIFECVVDNGVCCCVFNNFWCKGCNIVYEVFLSKYIQWNVIEFCKVNCVILGFFGQGENFLLDEVQYNRLR